VNSKRCGAIMSVPSLPLQSAGIQVREPALQFPKRKPSLSSVTALRVTFWSVGLLIASAQAWIFRYQASSDSISYLDMSDGVLRGSDWHRLINGVWSPLYPLLFGIFRRMFTISPGNEIAAGHLLNIVFFIFAFACFEFFLGGTLRELEAVDGGSVEGRAAASLPKWAFLPVAYSLFLWAAIAEISVEGLRADMLMSGFLYLAVGLLIRMHHRPARWTSYLALGAILGTGFLAKEAMLPIGVLIMATTFFVVESWHPALKMAAGGLALMLLIGSLYFVPLSRQQGHFTLGETGTLNYVVHVDQASPHWYLQTPGSAYGSFLHPPEKIFSDPPAYAFAVATPVTHPLRFDPLYWIAGVHPHFVLTRQIIAIKTNLLVLREPLRELRVVMGTIFVLAFLCSGKKQVMAALAKIWPVWLIGLAGCVMYIGIYVEPRYVAAFLTLFCLGMLVGFPVPRETGRKIAQLMVIATVIVLLYPLLRHTYNGYAQQPRFNVDSEAAQALESLGIKPGDEVARISPIVYDYAVERILRVQIVAEVDRGRASEFWGRPFVTQQDLLRTFASRGVKAVIATSPQLSAENQFEWTRLGSTQYWAWRANGK
jgi:hypothetical protein